MVSSYEGEVNAVAVPSSTIEMLRGLAADAGVDGEAWRQHGPDHEGQHRLDQLAHHAMVTWNIFRPSWCCPLYVSYRRRDRPPERHGASSDRCHVAQ
jgi:hypothetical protein